MFRREKSSVLDLENGKPCLNAGLFSCADDAEFSKALFRGEDCQTVLHPGAWLSLVERCVRDAEVAGSNPVAPTLEKRT